MKAVQAGSTSRTVMLKLRGTSGGSISARPRGNRGGCIINTDLK